MGKHAREKTMLQKRERKREKNDEWRELKREKGKIGFRATDSKWSLVNSVPEDARAAGRHLIYSSTFYNSTDLERQNGNNEPLKA
ncbi:unnamed protein product [Dracunculus medinensis]|uniref:Integrase n=1 Tax=Dracunculus medinensis TaxID=318479 RepID=A0A0N4UM96_DRAME|nr:unnamed protein product [Dracunculus medinensis]